MNDNEIVHRIGELAEQEHSLERAHAGEEVPLEDVERLRQSEDTWDQCWDRPRQRRARRAAGADPDEVSVRPAVVIEGYRQ